MRITKTTPKTAAITELGRRLALVRKGQGLTQLELAREAGLGVATLRRIEDGKDAQLGSWIKLLVALGMPFAIDGLLPEAVNSPLAEVRGKRPRARRAAEQAIPRWGDEVQ